LLHLGEVTLPHPSVARAMKSPTVVLRGEIVGAEGEKGNAVFCQEIALHAVPGPGVQQSVVTDPKAGLIELAWLASVFIGAANFVESRRQRFLILKSHRLGHGIGGTV